MINHHRLGRQLAGSDSGAEQTRLLQSQMVPGSVVRGAPRIATRRVCHVPPPLGPRPDRRPALRPAAVRPGRPGLRRDRQQDGSCGDPRRPAAGQGRDRRPTRRLGPLRRDHDVHRRGEQGVVLSPRGDDVRQGVFVRRCQGQGPDADGQQLRVRRRGGQGLGRRRDPNLSRLQPRSQVRRLASDRRADVPRGPAVRADLLALALDAGRGGRLLLALHAAAQRPHAQSTGREGRHRQGRGRRGLHPRIPHSLDGAAGAAGDRGRRHDAMPVAADVGQRTRHRHPLRHDRRPPRHERRPRLHGAEFLGHGDLREGGQPRARREDGCQPRRRLHPRGLHARQAGQGEPRDLRLIRNARPHGPRRPALPGRPADLAVGRPRRRRPAGAGRHLHREAAHP